MHDASSLATDQIHSVMSVQYFLLYFLYISSMPVATQANDAMSLILMALVNLVNLHDDVSNRWIVLTEAFSLH